MRRRHSTIQPPWQPRTFEDRLLDSYWRGRACTLYLEVPIGGPANSGNWPAGCTTRRIDGVCIANGRSAVLRFDQSRDTEFRAELSASFVEIIEVKAALNRTAIGQAIAARHMYTRQYGVSPNRVLILCERSDSALEWVCHQEKINVEVLPVVVGTSIDVMPVEPIESAVLTAGDEMPDSDLDFLGAAQSALTATLEGEKTSQRRRR